MILREVGLRMSDPVTFRAVADAPEVPPDLETDEASARLEFLALNLHGAGARAASNLQDGLHPVTSAEGEAGETLSDVLRRTDNGLDRTRPPRFSTATLLLRSFLTSSFVVMSAATGMNAPRACALSLASSLSIVWIR